MFAVKSGCITTHLQQCCGRTATLEQTDTSRRIIGKLTKSGIPGWFLNKIGYLFFRDGARLRTSAKRLQNAFWRLNPLRLVCAQHPKPFFRWSTPQNSANDGAQKVLSTNNPILFRNTPGIPCPVLRFYKPPDFVHTAPDFVHTAPDFVQFLQDPRRHGNGNLPSTQRGRSLAQDLSHNWQVADCDDCDATAAAQRSAVTDEQLTANNLYHLNPARKIPHTTGKLPTVTTVMQPQQHC